MIDKFKNNTKIKLIALLSALVLWLYVMAVVDPEETKLFEDIPVTISNMNELKEKDLIISQEKELTMDVSVSGKLSKLQKVTRENIHISGQINDPIEGKNDIFLRATTIGQVTAEIRNPIMVLELEKNIEEEKKIDIQVEGKSKINIDKLTIDKGIDSILVYGPRSIVKQVKSVTGVLDVGSKVNDFSAQITLLPLDEKGDEVKGVELQQSSIIVNVTLLKEKSVPIKLKFAEGDNQEINLKDYILSQSNVAIKGRREIIDKIEYIDTQEVDINDINNTISKDIYLNVPEGVLVEDNYITIKLNTPKTIKEEFVYKAADVDIRNNINNIDISTINIPDSINVSVEYLESVGTITKSDIKLYIDLSKQVNEGKTYDIKYDIKHNVKNIVVDPNKTS